MNKLTYTLFLSALVCSPLYAEEAPEKIVHEPLKMEFEKPSVDDFEAVENVATCNVAIAPVIDIRPNKETLGTKGSKPLFSKDVGEWANIGMASLKDYGYSLQDTDQPGAFIVEPQLYRLYSWPVRGFRIYGMLAMDIKITTPTGQVINKKYRGTGSTNNGWNGDGEYVQAMNDSLNIVVQRIANDIKPLCKKNT